VVSFVGCDLSLPDSSGFVCKASLFFCERLDDVIPLAEYFLRQSTAWLHAQVGRGRAHVSAAEGLYR